MGGRAKAEKAGAEPAVEKPSNPVDSGEKGGENAGTEPGKAEGPGDLGEAGKASSDIDPVDSEAFEKRLDDLVELCVNADFESGSLLGDIRDFFIEDCKHRPKSWSQMSSSQQRDYARSAEERARLIIRKVALVIAEQDDITVHATLKGYSADAGTFKLKLVARGDLEVAGQLYALDGHDVVLISADSKRFGGQRKEAENLPDQAKLEFADPGEKAPDAITSEKPEHPADDSDLAGGPAAEEEPEAVTALDKLEPGESVDLARGWIVKAVADRDTLEDVREATPDELAAERARQADFED